MEYAINNLFGSYETNCLWLFHKKIKMDIKCTKIKELLVS